MPTDIVTFEEFQSNTLSKLGTWNLTLLQLKRKRGGVLILQLIWLYILKKLWLIQVCSFKRWRCCQEFGAPTQQKVHNFRQQKKNPNSKSVRYSKKSAKISWKTNPKHLASKTSDDWNPKFWSVSAPSASQPLSTARLGTYMDVLPK